LFAEFVGSNAIKMRVALNGNGYSTVGIDGVICTLAKECEPMLLQVPNQILAFYRHQSSIAIDSVKAALTTGICFPLSW